MQHAEIFFFFTGEIQMSVRLVELAWRSGSVMDCHVTAQGSIPDRNGVFTELHVLRKGQ